MTRYFSPENQPREEKIMRELISKVDAITEQYLERFGKVRIGIYYIVLPRHDAISSFLNSLLITLRRKDLMPCYAWFSTSVPNTRYLILWCNGYFRTDLSDITPTARRIGVLHSMYRLGEINCFTGDVRALENINAQLNTLIAWNYAPIAQPHNRSFGTSALLR